MDISKAFKALDNINKPLTESTALDSYRQTIADIAQLETEIAALQQEKANGWKTDYESKLSVARDEVFKIKKDLDEVLRDYRTKHYTEFDRDGDPTNFEYHINEKEQKKLSIIEASIRERLAIAEAALNRLQSQLKQDHANAFATHSRDIKSKIATRDARKADRESIVKAIIEEEKPELEQLVAKIQKFIKVVPDWNHMTVNKNRIVLSLTGPGGTYTVDSDYDIDYDEDATIRVDSIDEKIQESVFEDGYFYDLANALGISEAFVDAADTGDLLEIPGSEWKLDYDFDLDYEEPQVHHYKYYPATRWEPDEVDIDYDEEVDWKVIYYLVKEI